MSPVQDYTESLRASHGESPRRRRAPRTHAPHSDSLWFWLVIVLVCAGAIETIVSIACVLAGGRW